MIGAIAWRFAILLIVMVVMLLVGFTLSAVLPCTTGLALGFAISLAIKINNGDFQRKPFPISAESEA